MNKPTEVRLGSSENVEPDADKESKLPLEKEQFHPLDAERENQRAFNMGIVGQSVAPEDHSREKEQMKFDSEKILSLVHLSLGQEKQNSPMGSFLRKSPTSSHDKILLDVQSIPYIRTSYLNRDLNNTPNRGTKSHKLLDGKSKR